MLITIFLILFYVNLLKELGVLHDMYRYVVTKFNRNADIFIPIIIGLIPMPGGAYFSASLLKLWEENRNVLNFINYWFRHVFVFSWPLYPSLIISMKILNKNYLEILSSTIFLSLAAIISGMIIAKNRKVFEIKENYTNPKPIVPIIRLIIL